MPKPPAKLLILIHAVFLLTGVVTTMLGPLLPELSQKWGLSDSQAGGLFALQSTGSLVGIAASSVLAPRHGFLVLLTGGVILMLGGTAGLSLPEPWMGAASILVYGSGLGIMIPTANVLTAELNPERRASALNMLNAAWCTGALIGPPLIAVALAAGGIRIFLRGLAATLLVGAVLYWLESRGNWAVVGKKVEEAQGAVVPRGLTALLISMLLFLYVGLETATWGWISTYARRLAGDGANWVVLQAAFWSSLLVGRLLSPLALRRISPASLVLRALILTLGGTLTLVSVTHPVVLTVGALATGLGLSSIYPTTVAIFSDHYGARSPRASGLVFSMAILGGAVIPGLIGLFSDLSGSLRAAMILLVACAVAMIVLQVCLRREIQSASLQQQRRESEA